jgi:hypothetical protein
LCAEIKFFLLAVKLAVATVAKLAFPQALLAQFGSLLVPA